MQSIVFFALATMIIPQHITAEEEINFSFVDLWFDLGHVSHVKVETVFIVLTYKEFMLPKREAKLILVKEFSQRWFEHSV